MSQFRALLLSGSAAILAACSGAVDVASPGEGIIIAPPGGGGGGGTAPDPDCPAGTTNVGTIEAGGGAGLFRNCQLSGTITGSLLLPFRARTIYSLSGRVDVGVDVGGDGTRPGGQSATLAIEPGVVLFGSSGADFLLVNRGSRLVANGTRTRPIVMTSRANILGLSTPASIGQWGGLVMLGRAPISRCIGAGVPGGSAGCESQIEGTTNALFGGALINDSSGSLQFVQVRYAGFEISPGNELNGITLGGVGAGTIIEHVHIHNGSDDGFEWFGGRVNGQYLVVTGADDDSLDTDIGYKGVNQFVLVLQRSGGGDRVVEAETSGNDTFTPRSNPAILNGTFLTRRSAASILIRGGSDFRIYNTIVNQEPAAPCVQFANPFTISAADPALDKVGPPVFRSTFFSCGATTALAGTGITADQITAILTGNNNVLNGTSTLSNGGIAGAGAWFPGANETAVPATTVPPPSTTNPGTGGVVPVNYIGAFRNSSDRWYDGWTCGTGGTNPACESAPTPRS